MAILQNGHLLSGVSGKLGNFILRQVNGKTVMCAVADRSQVKVSKKQKDNRKRFKAAVKYAKAIHDDPVQRAAYQLKLKRGETVYQYAMKEFFGRGKEEDRRLTTDD